MKPDRPALRPIQKAVAALLATGKTIAQISMETGIPVRTIYSWNGKKEFVEFADEQADNHSLETVRIRSAAQKRIEGAVDKAIDTLESIIEDTALPAHARGKACLDILHMAGFKPVDVHEVNTRVTDHLVMIDPTTPVEDEDDEDYGDEDLDDLGDDLDNTPVNDSKLRLVGGDAG